jgi:hypothetical protein
MNAKTRCRHRHKMQAALTRVLDVLFDNHEQGIAPDRTTALMAWEVFVVLRHFIQPAIPDAKTLPDRYDRSRFVKLICDRKKETQRRYLRGARGRAVHRIG